jgi:hypothetical protein
LDPIIFEIQKPQIYIYIYIYNPKTPNELTKPGSAAIEFRQIDDFDKNGVLEKGPAMAQLGTLSKFGLTSSSPNWQAILSLSNGVSTAWDVEIFPQIPGKAQ